jgi:hypothetical protein
MLLRYPKVVPSCNSLVLPIPFPPARKIPPAKSERRQRKEDAEGNGNAFGKSSGFVEGDGGKPLQNILAAMLPIREKSLAIRS